MLAELLIWAGVQAVPEARQLGYAKAAVSLWSRRKRCQRDWQAHEAKTRAFALDVALSVRNRGTVWLLGAGTLADLPLTELSAQYARVIVFDIALLPGARQAVRRFPNVELRLADVTGLVQPLSEWRRGMPLPIPSVEALDDLDPVPPDCILSLNLLSQLPLLPMEYVKRQGITQAKASSFGRDIMKAHLNALGRFTCPVGLTADAKRTWRSRTGEAVMSESAILDVTLPPAETAWTWPVAPRGEIDAEAGLEMTVQATRLGSTSTS